ENLFYRMNDDGSSDYAFFNYSEEDIHLDISLQRLGLSADNQYLAKELWTGEEIPVQKQFKITIPAKDVALLNFYVSN
ncbi:MAG: hypothetical protein PHI24_14595, partial [Desulfitobacteriaceae bacterium]|nr:hypothetical protein [Desulfitobacteriaceae bacterium]